MKLYQPVMFVGLGGTGCDIGAELERRLREEICGPDGNDFLRQRQGANLLPYQLPSCVQFVYADMNQAELDRLPRRVVPGLQHVPASALTAQYVRDLVPQVDTYPELARNLRLEAPRITEGWLPPLEDEPRVNPLHRGAGQFPTIGRAALFGTFMDGIAPAVRGIRAAIGLPCASICADSHASASATSGRRAHTTGSKTLTVSLSEKARIVMTGEFRVNSGAWNSSAVLTPSPGRITRNQRGARSMGSSRSPRPSPQADVP